MPDQVFESIATRELIAKNIIVSAEDLTMILSTGRAFIIADTDGAELFKLDKDSNNKARLFLGGKQVLG